MASTKSCLVIAIVIFSLPVIVCTLTKPRCHTVSKTKITPAARCIQRTGPSPPSALTMATAISDWKYFCGRPVTHSTVNTTSIRKCSARCRGEKRTT